MQQTAEAAALQRLALAERETQSIQERGQQCEKQMQQLAENVVARDKQVKQLKTDCRERDESISHLQLQIAALRETAEQADDAHNTELRVMQDELDGSVLSSRYGMISPYACLSRSQQVITRARLLRVSYRDKHSLIVGELEKQRTQQREHVQAVITYLLSSIDDNIRELGKENIAVEQDSKAQHAAVMLQTMLQGDTAATAPTPLHGPAPLSSKPYVPTTRPLQRRRSNSSKSYDRRQRQQHQQPEDPNADSDRSARSTHGVTFYARISHLQLRLVHSQEQLNTQQQQSEFLAAQLHTLQQDKTSLTTQLRTLHQQHASDKQQAKRRDLELQAQLQAGQRSEQQWNELQSDVDACKLAVKAAKQELQRKMRLLVAAQQEQQRMEKRIKQLEEEAVEKDKRVSKLQRQCQAREATTNELQDEVRELKDRQRQANEAEERVGLEAQELRDALLRSQQQAAELHDAAVHSELQIASLRHDKSEAEKQLGESRVLLDRQVDELLMWRRKEQDTQSTLAHTLSQLEEVKQRLSECQNAHGQSLSCSVRHHSSSLRRLVSSHSYRCALDVQLTCSSRLQRGARS